MSKREIILQEAVRMAEEIGIQSVTRNPLALRVGCANGAVSYHFETMENLRDEIVRTAVESENLIVIARALGEGHPLAQEASDELKQRALATLA